MGQGSLSSVGDGEGRKATAQAPRSICMKARAGVGHDTKQTLQSCCVSRVSRGPERCLGVRGALQTFVEEVGGGMAGPLG